MKLLHRLYTCSLIPVAVLSSTFSVQSQIALTENENIESATYLSFTELEEEIVPVWLSNYALKYNLDKANLDEVPFSENVAHGYRKGDWDSVTKWSDSVAKKGNYGRGVTIGIMDTIINCNHKNLKSSSKRTCKSMYFQYRGSSGVAASFTKGNAFDHGSNAAGVAAGTNYYGLAPKANIYGFAVFDDSGWYLSNTQYYNAVNYLVNTIGAKVLNWSYGVRCTPSGVCRPIEGNDITALRIANGKALVVKSAGNGYQGKGQFYRTAALSSVNRNVLKAYLNNLIIVGALNKAGTKIARWSDRPGETCLRGSSETKCHSRNKYKFYFIVAPGYVRSTAGRGDGSQKTMGTSFSAPIVAGAAALIQSRWSHLKPNQVRDILLQTATDMGRPGVDKVYGRGALNVTRALQPINGTVGGVKINSVSPTLFQRIPSSGDFAKKVHVIDSFDRDFEAVDYLVETSRLINIVEVSPGEGFTFHLSQKPISESSSLIGFEGFSANGLSYLTALAPSNEYIGFDEGNGPLDNLPEAILSLNTGNQAVILERSGTDVFAMTPNKDNMPRRETVTIGVSNSWEKNDKLSLKSTAALISEKGFHGLSSVKGFGFENQNTSMFVDFGLSNTNDLGVFDIGLTHHKTHSSYRSENISWNGLGISQLQLGFLTHVGDTKIGFEASSAMHVSGYLSSSIEGLSTADQFFQQKEKITLSFNREMTNRGSMDLNLSTERNGAIDISYNINF